MVCEQDEAVSCVEQKQRSTKQTSHRLVEVLSEAGWAVRAAGDGYQQAGLSSRQLQVSSLRQLAPNMRHHRRSTANGEDGGKPASFAKEKVAHTLPKEKQPARGRTDRSARARREGSCLPSLRLSAWVAMSPLCQGLAALASDVAPFPRARTITHWP